MALASPVEIAPSILAADFSALGDAIRAVERGGARILHVDVMDGHFVPNISIGVPVVASLRKATQLTLDVHLMIENPERYIDAFAEAVEQPKSGDRLDGPTQKTVAQVWHAVLGVPRLGPDDNFFEIGGHSLAMAAVQARLKAATGREIPIVELFRHPTIRTLAAHLDGAGGSPGLDRAARRLAVRRDRLRNRNEKGTAP